MYLLMVVRSLGGVAVYLATRWRHRQSGGGTRRGWGRATGAAGVAKRRAAPEKCRRCCTRLGGGNGLARHTREQEAWWARAAAAGTVGRAREAGGIALVGRLSSSLAVRASMYSTGRTQSASAYKLPRVWYAVAVRGRLQQPPPKAPKVVEVAEEVWCRWVGHRVRVEEGRGCGHHGRPSRTREGSGGGGEGRCGHSEHGIYWTLEESIVEGGLLLSTKTQRANPRTPLRVIHRRQPRGASHGSNTTPWRSPL